MSSGRDGVARELCGDEAERLTGSIECGEVRRCGLDGGLSSPAFWVERRRVLWRGSKEQAKGRTEWKAGVFVVPVRALREGGGLCSELATAAARWRPRGRL